MFKKALIALAFVIGAQCASAALPAFNQKFEKNGQPIAEKPLVARDFIEFRTARGFPLDGSPREGLPRTGREPHPLRIHLARQEPEARDEVREEDEAPRDLHLLA